MRCSIVKLDLMGRQQHRHTTVQRDIIKAAGTLVWQVLPTAVELLLLLLLLRLLLLLLLLLRLLLLLLLLPSTLLLS
jgi:hypothetical protein